MYRARIPTPRPDALAPLLAHVSLQGLATMLSFVQDAIDKYFDKFEVRRVAATSPARLCPKVGDPGPA